MEAERSEPIFKFDTILKSIFEHSGKELLKTLGFEFKIEKSINSELAELGQKLIPDFLYEGTLYSPEGMEQCIIHIEFQRSNDSKMIFRMGEYLFRIHRMINTKNYKIVQFLLYFGNEKNLMRNQLDQAIGGCSLSYRFNLIDTNGILLLITNFSRRHKAIDITQQCLNVRPIRRIGLQIDAHKILILLEGTFINYHFSRSRIGARLQIDGIPFEIGFPQKDAVKIEEEVAAIPGDWNDHRIIITSLDLVIAHIGYLDLTMVQGRIVHDRDKIRQLFPVVVLKTGLDSHSIRQ